mgnify:CR=1 FL=1
MKNTILVIHTGGTIAMEKDKETGSVFPPTKNPLTEAEKMLNQYANIITEEPFQLPSPHITTKEMYTLNRFIDKKLKEQPFIEGIVITHGTDTLEETAYFLDLTVQTEIPIVLTGAMRSSNEIGADGLYNLISSIRVAKCEEAKGKGVLVVLNDEIHAAKNVTKTHTSNISTFQSPQYGPIGIVTKKAVLFHHAPISREHYQMNDLSPQVGLLKVHSSMDSSLFYALKDLGYDGVVIEALGQGNVPPAAVPGIKSLVEAGIPVVLVSRCFNGIAEDIYAYEGGGKHLKKLGVIFSNGLNGQKARIKLLIALSQTKDFQKIEEMFQK